MPVLKDLKPKMDTVEAEIDQLVKKAGITIRKQYLQEYLWIQQHLSNVGSAISKIKDIDDYIYAANWHVTQAKKLMALLPKDTIE